MRTTLSFFEHHGILRRLWLTTAMLATISIGGCSLIDDLKDQLGGDDEPGHCESGRVTDVYFSEAIHFSASQQKWVIHNWKGTGSDGGCDIHINVHDGQITLSPLVRQAIQNGATAWKNAIVATGVRCDTYLHFESFDDSGVDITPHIDLEFVGLLQGGDLAGSTVVTTIAASRQFTHVRIQLASDLVVGNDTLAIPEAQYLTVIAHEYGHAFGILGFDGGTGHSSDPEDVMYSSAECSALSKGDIATMREVYTRVPYYTPAVSGAVLGAEMRETRVVCKF